MRPLALLLGLAVLALPVSTAAGREQPSAASATRLEKATGRISRLSRTRITVAKLTCTRVRTSPALGGLGVGARVAISCRGGTLTRIIDLSPPPAVSGSATATAAGSTAPVTTTAVATTASPSCPDTSYNVPSVVTLSQPGLTKLVDPAHAYPVTGNTIDEINASIRRCKPPATGAFNAVTRYSLNWSYASARQPDGMCRLTRVSVGIHVTVAVPSWTPGPGAAPGLADGWQTYISALMLHEQGHVDRDLASAQQLLDDLTALGEADCGGLAAQVSNLATLSGVALAKSHADYDNETAHGRTQGAVLQMP